GTAPAGDVGRGIALDAAGNLFVTGYFFGVATFGDFTLTSAGDHDVFVVKYSPEGDVLWAWSGGGRKDDLGARLALDAEGNLYLAAYFRGTATFDTFSLTSVGQVDVALLKFSPEGDVLWARSGGSTDTDACYQVSVGPSGDVYITGRFGHPNGAPATFGDFTITSAGHYDVFVVRYSPEGDVLWAWSAGGPHPDRAYGLAQDADGSTYVAGRFKELATFGDTTLVSAGHHDAFLAKPTPEGDVLWVRSGGGSNADPARDLALDAAGNVYVTGRFQGVATFGDTTLTSTGHYDVFLVKYTPEGDVLWARRGGGPTADVGYTVAVDAGGDAYVTGSFHQTATFGGITLTSAGRNDIFLTKYAADGTIRWAQSAGGERTDVGHGITVDPNGHLYVSGYFQGTTAFGPHPLTSAGGNDVFVAKYDPHPAVTVSAAPVDPPVVVGPGGGAFSFAVTLT